ncbi:MAG: hypothetical protein IJ881_03085, partial [Neisseriaceae bacterium]|nr:hypothetical protein [Neisseriaceae bacterium]
MSDNALQEKLPVLVSISHAAPLADDALDEFLLLGDLGLGLAHVVHELLDELAEEGLGETEEGVAVAD